MNQKIEELSKGLAVQVVAQKIADGTLDVSGSQTFEELARKVEAAVLDLAKDFGAPNGETKSAKPKRAPRAAAKPLGTATGGKRSGIDAAALRTYIGTAHSEAHTLQEIADHFSVSKGVAQRAVTALGEAVKSATGSQGKRGKAPFVYWLE